MQWKGAVFDPSAPVSVDVKHCLKKFQDVMFAHGLDLDQHWLRLLPPCLSSSQRTVADKTGAQKLKSTLYLRHMSATFVAYTI
ncbi:hypothetical protein G6F37_014126 [Rhizopus arrhizus]|nr:hypothetical protein G6F37_014126 [Rhizopus arrhizus]